MHSVISITHKILSGLHLREISFCQVPLNILTNFGFFFHITKTIYTGIPDRTIRTATPISEAGDVTMGTAIRKTEISENIIGRIMGI